LQYNIDPTELVPKEVIQDLIEKAGLTDLLSKHNPGKELLAYEIKEGGGNLSSGEK